jgi:hypothetical protein
MHMHCHKVASHLGKEAKHVFLPPIPNMFPAWEIYLNRSMLLTLQSTLATPTHLDDEADK